VKVERRTVDLSSYPDLVMIYLGMKVNAITGVKTLLGFGPKISDSAAAVPDGLLLHESMIYSLVPPHVGMRQYWRDFESLERWARSEPHLEWWKSFLRNSGGTGFWHEAYFIRGGMEAIYVDIKIPLGFSAFAPPNPPGDRCSARGPAGTARKKGAPHRPSVKPNSTIRDLSLRFPGGELV
jgi:Domain of unknown function (DUF4188)